MQVFTLFSDKNSGSDMPVELRRERNGAMIVVWRIAESEEELRALVTADDRAAVAGYSHARRRLEALAWRAAVRSVRPRARLSYNEAGAPVIDKGFISVSHTGGYAAVMFADKPCGIDIEDGARDLSRVAARFAAEGERALCGGLTLLWCAKEALYKWAGRPGLDMLRDIGITRADIVAGVLHGRAGGAGEQIVRWFVHDDHLVAYTDGAPE